MRDAACPPSTSGGGERCRATATFTHSASLTPPRAVDPLRCAASQPGHWPVWASGPRRLRPRSAVSAAGLPGFGFEGWPHLVLDACRHEVVELVHGRLGEAHDGRVRDACAARRLSAPRRSGQRLIVRRACVGSDARSKIWRVDELE